MAKAVRSEHHNRHNLRVCSLWSLIRGRPLPDMGGADAIAQMTAQNAAVRRKFESLEALIAEVREQKRGTSGNGNR